MVDGTLANMFKEENGGRNLSAASIAHEKTSYVAVSSESSLDSFIMGLPAANELPKFATRRSDSQRQSTRSTSSSSKPEVKQQPTFTRPSHTHVVNTSPHIPDFLYQLTKMLADENSEIIEWNNAGRIEVHNPHRLETEVLHKYFRHSKFASLQRQLNYFGFRKLAGKGKMAPCSYVNEAARGELSSLIYMKRKGSVSGPDPVEKPSKRKSSAVSGTRAGGRSTRGNPAIVDASQVGIDSHMTNKPALTSQQALARSAAGHGIRHGWSVGKPGGHDIVGSEPDDDDANEGISQLEHNYANCVNSNEPDDNDLSDVALSALEETSTRPAYGFLSRNSSLVDLAMIPEIEEEGETFSSANNGLTFVDFPNECNNSNDDAEDEALGF